VIPAQQRRLSATDDPQWVEAMVSSLDDNRWFRWFDSGDLQSADMLLKIFEVARRTPWCNHWVATRERSFVREALAQEAVPENLVLRVSATWPDVPVRKMYLDGVQYANVHKNEAPDGHRCAAPDNGGECGDCRVCWGKDMEVVSYGLH